MPLCILWRVRYTFENRCCLVLNCQLPSCYDDESTTCVFCVTCVRVCHSSDFSCCKTASSSLALWYINDFVMKCILFKIYCSKFLSLLESLVVNNQAPADTSEESCLVLALSWTSCRAKGRVLLQKKKKKAAAGLPHHQNIRRSRTLWALAHSSRRLWPH